MVNLLNGAELTRLKTELLGAWLEEEREKRYPDAEDRVTTWSGSETLHEDALANFDRTFPLKGGYRFVEVVAIECAIIPRMVKIDYRATITARTGAFIYHFEWVGEAQEATDETEHAAQNGATEPATQDGISTDGASTAMPTEPQPPVDVLIGGVATDDEGWISAVANLPRSFVGAWSEFEREVYKLAMAEEPTDRVMVIGGREDSFEANVDWEDVILPAALKSEILDDVSGFFTKGVGVYHRLKLKPFRKLLLAGVPGTGKTMLCAALAKWALEKGYLTIYVSSSGRWRRGDGDGASFEKIDHALNVAAKSDVPTLLIVEELDIYLRPEHKALILNVLDGSEAPLNPSGTLLIATTNYPEAIDERVLKRPGRLDRIFIIPETRAPEDAEKLLRTYLGDMWQESHITLVPQLIGFPGAFIREVAVYALTQVAYVEGTTLSLEVLENSFRRLKEQLDARDDFLKRRESVGFKLKRTTA